MSEFRKIRLNEILRQVSRLVVPAAQEIYPLIGVRWYGAGCYVHEIFKGLDLSASELRVIFSGDIIYNKMWASKGSFSVVPENFTGKFVTNEYPTFRVNEMNRAEYIGLLVTRPRFWHMARNWSVGSTGRVRLNPKDFLSFPVEIPNPLEQDAIVHVLKSIDTAILSLETLIASLEEAKTAVMRDLLTRGLAGEGARMVPLPERWVLGGRAEGITHMPAGWQLVRYDEACLSIQVGIVVQPASLYADVGVPALRSLNVKENQVERSNMVLISEKAHKANKKSELRAGNVVTVRTGVPGISAVVPDDLDGANCIDILISRIGKNAVPGFLTQFLNSSLAKRQIAVLQGGLAQQHLNVKELKGLKLLLPPLDEQIAIADAGEAFDRRIAAERAHLSELRATKDALAQELLSGRVRLPASMIARFETAPPHEAAAE